MKFFVKKNVHPKMFDNFPCPFNMKILLHLSNYKDSLIGVGVDTRLPLLIQLFRFSLRSGTSASYRGQ